VILRSVIGRGVVAIARMLEPVIVNVNAHSKAHILPAGSGRGHVGISVWYVEVLAVCDKD
jgi:hypothetical protein